MVQALCDMLGPSFGGASFGELLARIAGPRQIELLERAAQRGIVGNVHAPGRRVAALDAFVRRRASELASIQPVDHAELAEALNEAIQRRAFPDDDSYRLPTSA